MVDAADVRSRRRLEYKWQAAIIVVVGLFLSVLDNTIVSVALPNMRREFGTSFNTITWVVTAYFLAQAAVIPVAGYLSDRFGTKAIFAGTLGIFLLGSLLCMLAPNENLLIAARVVQGVGGGALMPTSFAIAYRAFPRDEWGRATTVIGVPVLLAPVMGPVVGGYLTSTFDWRAIFAINLPVGGIGLALALLFLRGRSADMIEGFDATPAPQRFDVPGFALSMIGFTTLVYGLTEAGIRGWGNPLADRALLIGAALLVALVVVELTVKAPVLDVRLFWNGTFARANLVLWAVISSFYGTLFLIPFFFESVQGASPLTAGEILIGQGIASAVGIAAAGELYNKVGPRWLVTAGAIALTLGTIGFIHIDVHTSGLSLQFWMVLRGLGLGLTTIPLQNLALSVVRHSDVTRASSLVNVMRQVFSAAGLAALAALVSRGAASHTAAMAASIHSGKPSGDALTCLGSAPSALSTCIRHQGVVAGLNNSFTVALVVCAAAILVALFIGKDPSLVALKTMSPEELSGVFPHLAKLELVEVISRTTPRSFRAGDIIMREGDQPEEFYIIARGEVRISARNGAGADRELRTLGAGEYFGEIGLLTDLLRTATITALTAVEMLVMDRSTFTELVAGSEETAQDLERAMQERLAFVP